MNRDHKHPTEPATTTQQALSKPTTTATDADAVRRAPVNERYGRAALFGAAACVAGVLALLVGQFGWWSLLLGPAYLAAVAVALVVARGRTSSLLAVAVATASAGIIFALIKLAGLG